MDFSFNFYYSPYYKSQGTFVNIPLNIISGTLPVDVIFTIVPNISLDDKSITPNIKIDNSGNITGLATYADLITLTEYTVTATYDSTSLNTTLEISISIPPNFSYPDSPYILATDVSATIIPTYVVDNAGTTYELSGNIPALPSGMVLNPLNGRITGIPLNIQNPTTYIINATNTNITSSATLNIAIASIPYFNYAQTTYILIQGVPVTIPVQTQPEGQGISYAIVSTSTDPYCFYPALPTGLVLNTLTGTISGTPTVLSTFRKYIIKATNSTINLSYSNTIIINVKREYLGERALTDTVALTDPNIAMRLKAEILQYKSNNANLTKNQIFSQTVNGHGQYANRVWASQTTTVTTPNTSGLELNGNTILCPAQPSVICNPTSASDVPGPIMNLCYNPAIPVVRYGQPNRVLTNIGRKWPQRAWSIGSMGFPIGKAGSTQP
jgi:hypothetical protein